MKMASIVLEEYELLGDSKYRTYMSQIDRALKAFESTTEWADLIAALDKLNKVLLAHMKYPIIPRRIVISKRLQQCMHHALPSGVHLKALATYDVIFKCMGTNRLAQELFLYSAGIFPLLGNAAMNVRPTLLTVYETHFVPLGERLRPALNGMLAGVLLGLEEGSDHFERTNKLLESICEAVQPTIFYGSLWECVASNASIRLPAISFILQHVHKKHALSEQTYIYGVDLDVVVTALSSSVQDSKILVQRNALDFLILAFPMHQPITTQGFSEEDRLELTVAGVSVLLRRDMSLNRRLFNWLLGTDFPPSQSTINPKNLNHSDSVVSNDSVCVEDTNLYFNYHSRSLLVDALRVILSRSLTNNNDSNSKDYKFNSPNLKPYRMLTALLDKSEIGPVVIEDVIIDVFRTLFHSYTRLKSSIDTEPEKHIATYDKKYRNLDISTKSMPQNFESDKLCNELIKTANLMFSIFEPSFIWEFCGSQFHKTSCQTYRISDSHDIAVNNVGSLETTIVEMCAITDFLLDIVSLETYPETCSKHLPNLFKTVITVIKAKCNQLIPEEITKALELAYKILSKVQPTWNAWNADEVKQSKHSSIGKSSDNRISVSLSSINSEDQDKSILREEQAHEALETSNVIDTPEKYSFSNSACDIHRQHEELMEECISSFKEFYVHFLKAKIFDSQFDSDTYMRKMMRQPYDSIEARTQHLESLLLEDDKSGVANRSSNINVKEKNEVADEYLIDYLRSMEVLLQDSLVFRLNEALRYSCRILIELSSLPSVSKMHLEDDFKHRNDIRETSASISDAPKAFNEELECHPSDIPEWLQYLLICSCLLSPMYADLQLESINTLLEMIDLLDSGIEQRKQQYSRISQSGVTSNTKSNENAESNHFVIVMQPLIKERAYKFIFHQTVAPQVIAAKLWDGLGAMRPVHHLACVKQLHRLHNTVPDASSIERIVARTLGNGVTQNFNPKFLNHVSIKNQHLHIGQNTVDAFQRFTLFWHLSRDQIIKKSKPGDNSRTFDVCLLKMLDNLNMSSGPLKTLSQSWLIHAMARGDIARIMEPLFLTLLDPTTARVSVLHCRIEHSTTVNTSDSSEKISSDGELCTDSEATHKIYTISTSFDVIYHVSENFKTNRESEKGLKNHLPLGSKKTQILSKNDSDRAMHLYALNTINNERTSVDIKNWIPNSIATNCSLSRERETEENFSHGEESDLVERVAADDFPQIPLLVNPFALVPPNVEEYESFTKGYCREPQLEKATKDKNNQVTIKLCSKDNMSNHNTSKSYHESDSDSLSISSNESSSNSSSDTTNQAISQSSLSEIDSNQLTNDVKTTRELEELEGFPSDMSTISKRRSSSALESFKANESRTIASKILDEVIINVVNDLSKRSFNYLATSGGCVTGPSSFDNISLNDCSSCISKNESGTMGTTPKNTMAVHPLHSHILLYTQVSDSRQVLYSMQCVKNMLQTNPRLAICTLSTTSLNSSRNSARSYQIQTLLARHRKSVFGRNFAGDLVSESMATFRNSTLIEVLISTSLYYLRSYYPNMGKVHLREEDIQGNREVQLMSIDILVVLVSELILVVRDNSQAYATYISDLFSRCKVQKVVLHCLLAGVNDMKRGSNFVDPTMSRSNDHRDHPNIGFTEDILKFNEINSLPESGTFTGTCEKISNYSEAFQVQVLRLLLSLVMLEQIIAQQKIGVQGEAVSSIPNVSKPSAASYSRSAQPLVLRYLHDQAIPDQPMFLAAIISALRHDKMRHLHPHWTSLVNSCLPFLGKSLSITVVEVTSQLCRNLEKLAPFYGGNKIAQTKLDANVHCQYEKEMSETEQLEREEALKESNLGHIPADYIVTQLESLTVITHYCLLESTAQVNVSFPQPGGISTSGVPSGLNTGGANTQSGEILNNLLHVFISHNDAKNLVASSLKEASSTDSLQTARKNLLSTLPRLVASCATLWSSLEPYLNNSTVESRMSSNSSTSAFLVGDPKTVRNKILDLLSPIAHHHPIPFLSAVSVAWQERRTQNTLGMVRRPLPTCNGKQSVLVELVASIKTLPVATVIQTVRQVLKTPPSITGHSGGSSGAGGKINVEVSVLQFFYFYLARCSPSKIPDLWPSLATLLKDCLALAPSAIFLALAILDIYVHRSSQQRDSQKNVGSEGNNKIEISRKESKELQEIAGKLVDECSRIGGSCLEQTTWLRRNMAVRHDLQTIGDNQEDMDLSETSTKLSDLVDNETAMAVAIAAASVAATAKSDFVSSTKKSLSQYSVAALALLGELLAPMLDIIYSSEEKEKVLPLLYNLMQNVVPYLRNHSRSNLSSFRACSRLLASLSGYQYTRKSWKKEGMELLLDSQFFQMDLPSLQHWRSTVDNLMTHDKTTFKELMAKLASINQSGSLNLFSSKEIELEQRALLLKRLAFVIYCSNEDQYQKQVPDIQERLAESLRTIPSSPAVQSAVFLCFRVILIRMSPQHVTSLWPLIITEMVVIFSYLEQELSTDSEEWTTHLKRMSTLDSSWVVSAGANGLAAHNSPAWLGLYLSVCKLLDLALALPANKLPQFQMYRWAFVSEGTENNNVDDVISSQSEGSSGNSSLTNGKETVSENDLGSASKNYHKHLHQQDFVPYVVRVARLLLQKVEKVKPMTLKSGEPQLTMTAIFSLEDLAPFFAALCDGVTRQQTTWKSNKNSNSKLSDKIEHENCNQKKNSAVSSSDIIDAVLERDFLESVTKQ